MLPLLLLLACPAQDLGIVVPESGLEAISMEDLTRDVAGLTTGPALESEAARRVFLSQRYEQMDLRPGPGMCHHRPGTGPERVEVRFAPGEPGAQDQWGAAAVAITLAKTLHGRSPDVRQVAFCDGAGPSGAVRLLELGPMGKGDTVIRETEAGLWVGQDTSDQPMDFRRLEEAARELAPVLAGWAEGG